MSNTPSKAEIEALVKRHGATSYRNRADTQHPAYGFTEDGLNGLIDEVLAKWGTPQQVVQEPAFWMNEKGHTWSHSDWKQFPKHRAKYPIPLYPHFPAPQPAPAPLIARSLAEWHEDDGFVAWWAWNGREWAGEPAWIGNPNCEDWPGYHTHWTPHPDQPVFSALAAQGGKV